MRISVERLRAGLVVGAGLLVLVIAGFLGYARYKVHQALVNLPGRMGATITKEFDGWTYSQSDGKKTVFTIHAAKGVQHTDGKLSLHDVSMILYGKTGDRADRITGDDFEYDTKAEVIRALGVVHLDLEAPVPEGVRTSDAAKHLGAASDLHEDAGTGSRVIHVKTSGLVYQKKLGVAATDQGIEFAFGGFTGHAVGAEYESDTGHVVLQSAVTVSGLDISGKGGDRPIAMSSSHGELDRGRNVAEFSDAHYSSAGDVARADLARVHLRGDGTIERIEGERRVSLEDAAQGKITSDLAEMSLDAKSRPESALLTGNVHFADDEALRQASADSDRADIRFDAQGHIDHAVLLGRVRTWEMERRAGHAVGALARRDLQADSLELSLVTEGTGSKLQLREAKAIGSARMISSVPDATGNGVNTTKLAGDSLLARLVSRDGGTELSTLHGAGHTVVERTSASGVDQTSFGEILDAAFRESSKSKGAVELASAVQEGGVVMDRRAPAKKATLPVGVSPSPELLHATAAKASFDGNTDRMTLSGDVRLRDAASELAAGRVVMDQDTGDATADGLVKVNYLQTEEAEPVHVLAARAELNRDDGRATFYGRGADGATAGVGMARMWQAGTAGAGGSQVEGPVLVFEQEQRRLTARAAVAGTANMVHAVLARASTAKGPTDGREKEATNRVGQGLARITSSFLVYSDLQRRAEFSGGVRVLDGSGEMRAQEATVFLAATGSGGASKKDAGSTAANSGFSPNGLFGGSVERIVATQHIEISQPGRKATGERLVYTASDQMFVLTGTAAAPPKVVDSARGTTTGAMLRFHSGDDSVVIAGSGSAVPAQRVRTETQVRTETKVKEK